ncbi:hypothetical protein J6590_091151 [Homalodisca vitripennis]|nr:hypothetical protein J6590_091151 [Homalodisca vitripennis]
MLMTDCLKGNSKRELEEVTFIELNSAIQNFNELNLKTNPKNHSSFYFVCEQTNSDFRLTAMLDETEIEEAYSTKFLGIHLDRSDHIRPIDGAVGLPVEVDSGARCYNNGGDLGMIHPKHEKEDEDLDYFYDIVGDTSNVTTHIANEETQYRNSLISCKNRGGLLQPSEGVVKLCLLCETEVKLRINKGDVTTVKKLEDRMVNSVLRKCIGVNLFPGGHCFEQDPGVNHLILVKKAICKQYFKVRLHHHCKNVSASLHKSRIRSHL